MKFFFIQNIFFAIFKLNFANYYDIFANMRNVSKHFYNISISQKIHENLNYMLSVHQLSIHFKIEISTNLDFNDIGIV